MTRALAEIPSGGGLRACMVTQVTPLLVSFDGGATTVPGDKIAGATYSIGTSNNARALMDSPNKPLVFPIG